MQAIDFNILKDNLDEINAFWWLRGDKASMFLSEQVSITMQEYMKTHPEYYGCCE